MPNSQKDFLTSLTASEMEKLLVARKRIDVLLGEKAKLTSALKKIEDELSRLMDGGGKSSAAKAPVKKKSAPRKKAVRKKVATRKVSAKKVVKKAAAKKKVVARKSPAKKKPVSMKAEGRVKLEDVIVRIIKSKGKSISYKDLMDIIVKKKLFKSKSSNFDNVLRRTLSTSKLVKRVGRGVYAVA